MKRKRTDNNTFDLKWHRRVGLSIMIVLVFLSITGILLNHSPAAGLSKKILSSEWLMNWYGFETSSYSGFQVGKQWISHPGDRDLLLGAKTVANCPPPLINAALTPNFLVALCSDELVILTANGDLVEKINLLSGLPEYTTNLKYSKDKVLIESNAEILSINLDSLEIVPSEIKVDSWPLESSLPAHLVKKLNQASKLPGISLETIVLDLHSGRFFGDTGVLFVDFIGLLTVFLAITGLYSWLARRRKKKK